MDTFGIENRRSLTLVAGMKKNDHAEPTMVERLKTNKRRILKFNCGNVECLLLQLIV